MSKIDDGGPAFPVPNDANVNGEKGIYVRDYFAAKAMKSLMDDRENEWTPGSRDLSPSTDGLWWTVNSRPFPWRSQNHPHVSEEERSSLRRWKEINTWRNRLARDAYTMADAMIAARKSGGGA